MAKRLETPVLLVNQPGEKQQGKFIWKQFTTGERLHMAGVWFIVIFGLANCVYLIPILHLPFIAYPRTSIGGFFVLALLVAWRQYRRNVVADGVGGRCPSCKKDMVVDLDGDDRVPLRKYCPLCGKPLDIIESS